MNDDKTVLNNHVLPAWRDWRLRDIERLAVQQWIADRFGSLSRPTSEGDRRLRDAHLQCDDRETPNEERREEEGGCEVDPASPAKPEVP
jgi:hypothetical protein